MWKVILVFVLTIPFVFTLGFVFGCVYHHLIVTRQEIENKEEEVSHV